MFWLWHKDRLLFYSVQRNSKFTSFSRNRKKKYWFQGWIASWQNILIISRISWNNFSKVFTLFFTVYYVFLNISVQVSASIFLCLAAILFEGTSVAFINSVYSIVTCNKMATWGWGWLPGIPLCLPVRRGLSLSQLIKIYQQVDLLWLEQDYFLLINGVWNCFSLAARLIFFSVSWQTQQFHKMACILHSFWLNSCVISLHCEWELV